MPSIPGFSVSEEDDGGVLPSRTARSILWHYDKDFKCSPKKHQWLKATTVALLFALVNQTTSEGQLKNCN